MIATVPIARDLDSVDGREFDVVIAGAGIYGALCAVEAAHRGLRTLLVDRGDFGGGTSFQSLRTIHGGLRYLQRLDFARARASSRQRDWWLVNFPDLVVQRACLMPLYGRSWRGPAAFRAAAMLARGLRLNSPGLPKERRLPALTLVGPAEVSKRFPGIPASGLKAGALWHDAFMPDSARIVVECVRWAAAAGARVLNYMEVAGAQGEGGQRSRLSLLDRTSGARLAVTTRAIVNATGSRINQVARRLAGRSETLLRPTVAWNLLLEARLPGECCLVLTPPRRRVQTYFVQPFHGQVLAGTGHAAMSNDDVEPLPPASLVKAMREDLDAAYPEARLGRARVLRTLAGVLPGVRSQDRQLAVRPKIVRDAVPDGGALIHVVGVKFTEAPDVARRALDLAFGDRRSDLAPRPLAAEGWNVVDGTQPATRESLLELAASESVVYLEDLIERRTNAWCDEAARQRVMALVGGRFDQITTTLRGGA